MTRLILVLGLASFAGALATRATDPFVGVLALEFAAPAEAVALLATAFALPYAGVQPVLGPVGDALGKRRVIGWGLFVLAAALLACALAPSLAALFAARALAGAAAGGVMPLTLAVMGDEVALKDRQVAISRLLLFGIGGQIAGGVLAGLLAERLGWRGVLLLCAAAALAAGVGMHLAARRDAPEPRRRLDPAQALRRYRAIIGTPAARVLYAAVCVEGMLVFGLFPFVAPLLQARGLGGVAEAGLVVGAFGLGGVLYVALARPMLARLGQQRMVRLGGAFAAAALLGVAAAPAWPVFAAAMGLLGLGFFMIHNSIQTRATEIAPAARGSAMALHAFSFFGGQSLGPVVFGAGLGALGAPTTLALCGLGLLLLALALARRPA